MRGFRSTEVGVYKEKYESQQDAMLILVPRLLLLLYFTKIVAPGVLGHADATDWYLERQA